MDVHANAKPSCGRACECFHQSHWKGYNDTARWRKRVEILRTSHPKHTIIHSLWGFPPTLFFLFPLPIIIDDANFVAMPKAKNRIPLQPVYQLHSNHPGNKSCYFPQIFPFMNFPNSYPSTYAQLLLNSVLLNVNQARSIFFNKNAPQFFSIKHLFSMYLSLDSLQSKAGGKIWVQVVYMGNDPRKQSVAQGMQAKEGRKTNEGVPVNELPPWAAMPQSCWNLLKYCISHPRIVPPRTI